ncbi:unnamed protein product [Closterium sp. NIES-53]
MRESTRKTTLPRRPAEPRRPTELHRPTEPRRPTEPHRPTEPRRPTEPHCPACAAPAATAASAATAATAAMATPTIHTLDAEGRAVDFDVWVDDLQLFLQCDSRDGVSLFDHTSGVSNAPAATADSTRTHFGQYKTAKSLYDAVVAHYSSLATTALSRLMLPYLFPDLAAFATVADLITHLRITRLLDSLASVRDHFLSLFPTELTVDLLEERLPVAEKSILAVGASRSDPHAPFFEGCSPIPLLPFVTFAADVALVGTAEVGAASAPSGRRRNSKGKVGKGGGGDGGGGAGGGGGGGGGGSGGGGGGGIGGFGGGGGGGGGSGSGGGGSGSGGGGGGGGGAGRGGPAQHGGLGGSQRQQKPRSCETPLAQQLREWYAGHGRSGGVGPCTYVLCTGGRRGETMFSIFDLDFDALLAAIYAMSDSAEGDYFLCVPPDPGIEAVALGASVSAAPGTSESAALGAGESALSGTAPTEALHTFTLDSSASCSFFRDSTTLTPLSRPVVVSLADPSGGPVLAHSSTVLPCPAAPSGLLSGLHLPSFSTNLVSGADLQDLWVDQFTPRDRGGEFSSDLLRAFCHAEGIHQTFTFSASPQQNGIAERRIGMVMDVARTSMIHAVAPHFLWPFAVQCAAHQINLQPHVSLPETTPTLRWTGKVGDASVFRHAPSGVSQVDPVEPVEVAVDSGAARGAEPAVAGPGGTELGVAESEGAEPGGAEPKCVEPGGSEPEHVEPEGAEPVGAESGGAESGVAEPERAESGGPLGVPSPREPLSPQQLREWYAWHCRRAAGAAGAASGAAGAAAGVGAARSASRATGGAASAGAAGAAGPGGAGAGGTGTVGGPASVGAAGGVGANGPEGARTGGTGAAGAGGAAGVGAVGAGAVATGDSAGAGAVGGTGAGGAVGVVAGDPGAEGPGAVSAVSGGAARPMPYFVPLLQQVLGLPPSSGPPPPLLSPLPVQSPSQLQPVPPLPGSSPYFGPTRGLTERREPESRPASPESRPESPVCPIHTGRPVPRQSPPPVSGTQSMTLRPSTAQQRVPLPSPPASSLPDGPDLESESLRAASPTVTRFLATAVTDPSFESTSASALIAELIDFAAAYRLDYATSLVAESESASVYPPSIGGECALGTDILEDRKEEFECFAAAVPHLMSMLLAPEVKRPPGSPHVFKARYVARGISQRQGVDFFQTFSPTPKMTTLWVLLHVAAQRDYELHSLDFSTAFLQGSLHEEIWLRRPPDFTGSFPAGTQWSLSRPVYGIRHAPPRE